MSMRFGFEILTNTRVIRKVYILNGQPSYIQLQYLHVSVKGNGHVHLIKRLLDKKQVWLKISISLKNITLDDLNLYTIISCSNNNNYTYVFNCRHFYLRNPYLM